MTYKRIRDLAVFGLALLLSMSLSGCSFSFLGFRLGKSEDFVFYCAEESQDGQTSAVAEDGTGGSADAGAIGESVAVTEDAPAEEPLEEDAESGDTRVNINTADREALMTLNGIGESRADAIIEYRTQHGSFTSTEQIMEVSGIAEGIYAKIKDQIRVQ